MGVSVQNLRLMLPFLRLPWDLLLRILHFKIEKYIKIGHFRNITFMVYIFKKKLKEKVIAKNLSILVQLI